MVDIQEWLDYLNSNVNKSLYVWGANGESIVTLLPQLTAKESSVKNLNRVLTLLQKRLLENGNIFEISCMDCSGLFMGFALKHNIFKYDMTANTLYNSIPNKISLSNVQVGDFLFKGTDTNKTHVGYAISEDLLVEAKDRDVGVVITKISKGSWKYAARPYWWTGSKLPNKQPKEIVTLTRELRYTTPLMAGDDVKLIQNKLNDLNFNCGEADGLFGKKTETSVKNFQVSANLTSDGIVGRKTAEKLGFKWNE